MFENIESTLFDHGACVGSCKRSLKTVNLPLETSSDSEHLQLPFLWERLVPLPTPQKQCAAYGQLQVSYENKHQLYSKNYYW